MPQLTPTKSFKEERRQAAERKRHLIQNNDGADARYSCDTASPEEFLGVYTSGLKGSRVSTISYCTHIGFGTVSHRSQIATPLTAKTGSLGKNILGELIQAGTDPLQIMVDFCRGNDIEIFASFRMNDIHDSDVNPDGTLYCPEFFSPWKHAHPDYLLGEYGQMLPYYNHLGNQRGWSGADYGIEAVRDYMFSVIEEVCLNYDVDGIELDFMRHPQFFKSHVCDGKAEDKDRAVMSQFVARLRQMTEKVGMSRGRPLLVAIRTPDSVGFCRDIGLDIEHWMQKDYFDLFIPGGYIQMRQWADSVELGHRYGIPVYPALEESRFIDLEDGFDRNTLETYRARTANVWSSGADGVYLFNAIYLFEPDHPAYRELGDPQALKHKDKTYYISYLSTALLDGFLKGSMDRHMLMPALHSKTPEVRHLHPTQHLTVKRGQSAQLPIQLEDDFSEHVAGESDVIVLLRVWVDSMIRPGDVQVTVNDEPLAQGNLDGHVPEYRVDPSILHRGMNNIGFSSAHDSSSDLVICDAQVRVSYQKTGG